MCRRWSGGVFMAVACEQVTVEPTDSLGTYISSDWAERQFCKNCGASLFWRMKGNDGHAYVAASAFDTPFVGELGHEVFIDEKPAWYALAGERPRLTGAEVIAAATAGKE
jgi:hypothetical protein